MIAWPSFIFGMGVGAIATLAVFLYVETREYEQFLRDQKANDEERQP